MEWYEEEVRALEHAHTTDPPPAGATVFYGSSSLRLWASLADDLAPWPVVNRAFGGSTLAVGEEDLFLASNQQLSTILWDKGVWHALRVWPGEAHCAAAWRRMVPWYL